jgi:antitoxin PrlF
MATYAAKATTAGNSKALRFDRALFQAHPEFAAGEFRVQVLGPGAMLVTTTAAASGEKADADPLLEAYLAFMEDQMRAHPEHIRPLTAEDIRGLDALLANVVVDRNEDLGQDFELP